MILLQTLSVGLIILGLLLIAISYSIYRITRSPAIGALFVLLIIVAVVLIGLGIFLLEPSSTAPTNSTITT